MNAKDGKIGIVVNEHFTTPNAWWWPQAVNEPREGTIRLIAQTPEVIPYSGRFFEPVTSPTP